MKKFVAMIAAAGLLASMTPAPARAGDHGWATAGKILTGVIGLSILGHAIADAQPVYYAPAPRTYYEPPREDVWVPGHYEMRYKSRWVPGHWEAERYARPYYDEDRGYRGHGDREDDYDDGPRSGRIWVPGHYEKVEVRVWIPGHWEERG